MKEKLKLIQILIKTRTREGFENERRVGIKPEDLTLLQDELVKQENIKEAWIYEKVFYHHKTYAEDLDPEKMVERLTSFVIAFNKETKDAK